MTDETPTAGDERPLSPLATRLVIMGVGAALVVGTIVWSLTGSDDDSLEEAPAPEQPAPTHTAEPLSEEQVLTWLPHSTGDLAAAGLVALAYAEQAGTIDHTVDTDGSLQAQALAELSTTDHAQALETGSSAAAARRELAEAGTSSSATASIDRIDRWSSSTVTFLVDVAVVVTSDAGVDTTTSPMVITVAGPDPVWQVAAAADAGVGQAGDTAATQPTDAQDNEDEDDGEG